MRVVVGLPPDLPAVAVEGGAAPGVPSVVADQVEGAGLTVRDPLPADWSARSGHADGRELLQRWRR